MEGAGSEKGIGIDTDQSVGGRGVGEVFDIGWVMDAFERIEGDCLWTALLEVRKLPGLSKMGKDRLGARGALRVAVLHDMPVVGGVVEESEIHGRLGRSQTSGTISK